MPLLGSLKSWLAFPSTVGLDLDDPRTTELRRRIVREKGFLRRLYTEWYRRMAAGLPDEREVSGPVLELGSGPGFLSEFVHGLITSDVFPCPGVQRVIHAHQLPFAAGELRGIAMTNVFHHMPDVNRFLAEATRCVRPGGAVVMLEPWLTRWSRFVYRRLHHEPFDCQARAWSFPESGPLSAANGALPWIVFHRDRDVFRQRFPRWRIESVQLMMPFTYLLSGGVSMRSLAPGWLYAPWRAIEGLLSPWRQHLAMFALIVLRRGGTAADRSDGGSTDVGSMPR